MGDVAGVVVKRLISTGMDALVVPGFSRVGHIVRSRLNGWEALPSGALRGKTVVLTGPTSGLGLAAAHKLAALGAELVLVGRSETKCRTVAADIARSSECGIPDVVIADMADLDTVAQACRTIRERHQAVDVVVHNAGALLNHREVSPQGIETTLAAHVVGPHLMTRLLLEPLRVARGRVVTVSSGGMYAAPLPAAGERWTLEMPPDKYSGTRQYAIAKRAQVTMNEIWARREPAVTFVSMHPGWADTPGVQESIPLFRRVTRPILRTADEGCDTIVWLAAVGDIPGPSGTFWCDREVRSIHRTPGTRRSDTDASRATLWEWCQSVTDAWCS